MKRFGIVLMIAMLLLSLAGCGNPPKESKADKGTGLRVVTSFYPMYVAALNVTRGIDGVEVVNMTKPQTGCLHDYQLSTEDMKTLEKANVFVINGGGMEAFLDKVIQRQKNLQIVDASKGIELLQENGEPNPHVWVSVSDAILQVQNIADQLSAIDEAHAAAYQSNAAAYIAKLEALKKEMHAAIDPLLHRDIVTFHEAFPYFAKEFNLHIAAVIEHEPGTEPSPKEIQETAEKVKALPVRALFTEPQYSPTAAQTIARESGATIYALDPVVTGDADASAADAYINAMRKNMQVLVEALH